LYFSDRNLTTFEVATVWKDELPARTTVFHRVDEVRFGFGTAFKLGEEWLIFARKFEGELRIFDGIRLEKLCDAKMDLAAFGSGKHPPPHTQSIAQYTGKSLAILPLLAFLCGMVAQARRKYRGENL
jgi:hypothetical protein